MATVPAKSRSLVDLLSAPWTAPAPIPLRRGEEGAEEAGEQEEEAAPASPDSGALLIVALAQQFTGTEQETDMRMRAQLLFLVLFLSFVSTFNAEADCSGSLCADCNQDSRRRLASCTTVAASASCECSISVSSPEFCVLGGACTYTGGGGGGGGGGTGGGSSSCTRGQGDWCPAECPSCTTIFWY